MATMVMNLLIFKTKKTYYHPPHTLIRIYEQLEIMGKLKEYHFGNKSFKDYEDDFLDDDYEYQKYKKKKKKQRKGGAEDLTE
jgi:hypothetical protein